MVQRVDPFTNKFVLKKVLMGKDLLKIKSFLWLVITKQNQIMSNEFPKQPIESMSISSLETLHED